MTIIKQKGYTLIHSATGVPVNEGEEFNLGDRPNFVIVGGAPPHKEGSSGRVFSDDAEYFPSVIKTEWVFNYNPKGPQGPHARQRKFS
jgi:uracil-DNA glycosylase